MSYINLHFFTTLILSWKYLLKRVDCNIADSLTFLVDNKSARIVGFVCSVRGDCTLHGEQAADRIKNKTKVLNQTQRTNYGKSYNPFINPSTTIHK